MNPQQAWNLIASVCAQLKISLNEHQQIQQALQILKPKEDKKAE